jgi:hypothetical protein
MTREELEQELERLNDIMKDTSQKAWDIKMELMDYREDDICKLLNNTRWSLSVNNKGQCSLSSDLSDIPSLRKYFEDEYHGSTSFRKYEGIRLYMNDDELSLDSLGEGNDRLLRFIIDNKIIVLEDKVGNILKILSDNLLSLQNVIDIFKGEN